MGKKKEDKCKMKVIRKVQMMWDEMRAAHELNTKEMLKLTFDQLWEKQMDVGYLYKRFTK